MKNSIKKLIFVLAVMAMIATLAFALAACNNDAQTQTTPPTGGDNNVAHVHAYGEWTVVEPATHTKVGKQECRCECGATVQAEVPKLPDHEFVEWKTVIEPECMQDGLKESECLCGEKKQERIPALGHKWDDGICTKCGEWQNLVRFKTLTFANYNHTASGTVANAVTKFSFANELELSKSSVYKVSYDEHGNNNPDGDEVDLQEGNNTFYLTVTRDDDVEIITVSIYRNHMYSLRFDGIEEAQQVEEGHKAVAPQEKPTRTGYTFDSWDFDFDTEINYSQNVYAKWTANVYTVTLDVAGGDELEQTQFEVTYGESFIFPVAAANLYRFMGWSYDQQILTRENGIIYRWEIADDVTLKATYRFLLQIQDGVIVGNDSGLPSELVIPAKTMDGQDIVGIGANAFRYSSLTSVTIPASITSMSENAFSGMYADKFSSVHYQGSLKDWCNIEFGNKYSNPMSAAHDGQLFVLDENGDEKEVTGDIAIPDGVTIVTYALCGTTSITSVAISDSVSEISSDAFASCLGLKSITVSQGNATYQSKDGIVYKVADKTVYIIPKNIQGAVSILDGCLEIGDSIFKDYTGISEITIPDSVTSIGDYAFSGCTGLQTVNWNATSCTKAGSYYNYYIFKGCTQLATVNIGEDVQSIPTYVFYGCTGIVSVTIPESVQSIGDYAFSGCTGLQTVNWNATSCAVTGSNNYPIFKGCTQLTTVNIGEDVLSLPENAFRDCLAIKTVNWNAIDCSSSENSFRDSAELQTINIGASVENIANAHFDNYTHLKNIEVDPDNGVYCDIDGIVFSKDEKEIIVVPYCAEKLTLPEGFEDLGSEAVKNSHLTSIYIPSSVNVIDIKMFPDTLQKFEISNDNKDYSAFSGVLYNKNQTAIAKAPKAISEVTFPQSLQVITEKAFSDCKNLTSVTIPDSVTSIGADAFYACTGLKEIMIPDSVQSIGGSAFYYCTGLTEITIPDSVQSIGNSAFTCCTGLQTATINAQRIGWSFSGCTNLQTVIIGENVQSIGGSAFENCTNLETVTFSGESKLKEIGSSFTNCSHLKSITIPASVTSIGRLTFEGCIRLKDVTFEDPTGWQYSYDRQDIPEEQLRDHATAAELLTTTYVKYDWYRKTN